jgi:hypothetical protein
MGASRSGGAQGRTGGRLSGGSRAQKALHKAARVRVIGVVHPAAAAALTAQAPSVPNPLAAATDAAARMSELIGLSPGTTRKAAPWPSRPPQRLWA